MEAVEAGRQALRAADLRNWKARVVTLLGGRSGTMPQREWRRLFITGSSPQDAAKIAETYRRNTQAAAPKRRRR